MHLLRAAAGRRRPREPDPGPQRAHLRDPQPLSVQQRAPDGGAPRAHRRADGAAGRGARGVSEEPARGGWPVGEAYGAQGYNIGMNLGRTAGAGIADHLHWHVVPRWNGDTNFMPVLGDTKVMIEHLHASWDKLRPLFDAEYSQVAAW